MEQASTARSHLGMSKRVLFVLSCISGLLALPHLIPPRPEYFFYLRAWLAGSRVLQGPAEFASYSLLPLLGLRGPLPMFLFVAGLSVLTALIFDAICQSRDELRDIFPSLLFLYLLFGVFFVNAGAVLVGSPTSCVADASQSVHQRVVSIPEIGLYPGAHYFLLQTDPSVGTWHLVDYRRLDVNLDEPCGRIAELFPP